MAQDESRPDTSREAREAAAERAAIAVRPEFHHSEGITREKVFELKGINVHYSGVTAVKDITMDVQRRGRDRADRAVGVRQEHAAALPEPDERPDPGRRSRGRAPLPRRGPLRADVDPVQVRKLIGMVFQKPNPFPKSIYDNVAFGPRVLG